MKKVLSTLLLLLTLGDCASGFAEEYFAISDVCIQAAEGWHQSNHSWKDVGGKQ